ncbi:MAG: hypothetical protein JXC32_20600, partial [Anaerolineae bacterium]|nr:hypothetical protein [Anaerolineae bacterium]
IGRVQRAITAPTGAGGRAGSKGEREMTETRTDVYDRIRERIAEARARRDARPVATITEELGRLFVTVNGRREPLPDEAHAMRRIDELVADGWRIHDPDYLLHIWSAFDDATSAAEADRDAAGYPDYPAGGTPAGDALMTEEAFLRFFGADHDEGGEW